MRKCVNALPGDKVPGDRYMAPTSSRMRRCHVPVPWHLSQLIRYATILLDISEESGEAFDELLIEHNARGAIWLHFAVRPSGNRKKVLQISS